MDVHITGYSIVNGKLIYTLVDSVNGVFLKKKPEEIEDHSMIVNFWKSFANNYLGTLQASGRFTAKPRFQKNEILNDKDRVHIVGTKTFQGKKYIAIQEVSGVRLIDIEDAKANFPAQLATFYESHIVFIDNMKQ